MLHDVTCDVLSTGKAWRNSRHGFLSVSISFLHCTCKENLLDNASIEMKYIEHVIDRRYSYNIYIYILYMYIVCVLTWYCTLYIFVYIDVERMSVNMEIEETVFFDSIERCRQDSEDGSSDSEDGGFSAHALASVSSNENLAGKIDIA